MWLLKWGYFLTHPLIPQSLPELTPPCSLHMISHVTSVISLQKYCHNWPVPIFRAGWHSGFHTFLSHSVLVQASSLDASFGRAVLLQILQHSRDQSSPCWTFRNLSRYTLEVRLTSEVPAPYSAEMAPISYIYSTVTFWDASSRTVWTTDADGNVRHSPNMRSHNLVQTIHACSPEKP